MISKYFVLEKCSLAPLFILNFDPSILEISMSPLYPASDNIMHTPALIETFGNSTLQSNSIRYLSPWLIKLFFNDSNDGAYMNDWGITNAICPVLQTFMAELMHLS